MKTLVKWLIVSLMIFNIVGISLLVLGVNVYSLKEKTRAADKRKVFPKAILIPSNLKLTAQQTIKAGAGVKSVLSDPQKEFLYAFNLEGMSVYEYDAKTKKKRRTISFEATQGQGFNYTTREWYNSLQEKPVEGCFTHNGRYLWVSLHNAEGVVVWDRATKQVYKESEGKKKAFLQNASNQKETIGLYFFKTGKTPKVISASPKNDFVFVANWHDNTVSVIDIRSDSPKDWKVIENLRTGAVPRGNIVSADGKTFFLGHMGSTTLARYSISATKNPSFELDTLLKVGRTPRHLVFQSPFLFATLSSPEKLIKIDVEQNKIVQETTTDDDPRTVAFSPDKQLLFVTCYAEETLQVFRAHDLQLLGSWESKGKPVGVSVLQKGHIYEAWVCNYTASNIKIFKLEIAP